MTDKDLQKLKRRELLQMLLVQCQETEKHKQESIETRLQLEELTERYERLIGKLNIKDERLNQKDAKIRELRGTIDEMKASRAIELSEAGNIAEAALRLNGVFEAAQKAAEQYLMNVQKLSEAAPAAAEENKIPFEQGWRAGVRKKTSAPRARQIVPLNKHQGDDDSGRLPAASGDVHG
ncbi:MAG: hypothetical protein K1W34_09590 [Lachnospiraceae bacterium]